MKRLILAGALALAAPLHAHAGPRCHKLGQRFAAKRATVAPARVVPPAVGAAVVAPVARVFRLATAPVRAVCANGNCK